MRRRRGYPKRRTFRSRRRVSRRPRQKWNRLSARVGRRM